MCTCMYLSVKGMRNKLSGFLASYFLSHSQVSYGILPNQFHCLHAEVILTGFMAPAAAEQGPPSSAWQSRS